MGFSTEVSADELDQTRRRWNAADGSDARLPPRLGWSATLLASLLALTGCSRPAPPSGGQAIDPVAFFTGHVTSWGVMETPGAAPLGWVRTDCQGTETDGVLHMTQHLTFEHDSPQTRVWTMRALGGGRFEAGADDMVGKADGEATGRTFHWRWTLALVPDALVRRVDMEQWMYRLDDGSVLIRTVISRFGITLREVTERFTPA